jgi:CheY-like chemotaxis protein
LQWVLVEQGYYLSVASSLEEALRLVHQQPFDLLLTELLAPPDQETLAFIQPLRELAYPTPVVVIDTWLSARQVRASGFATLLSQPFTLNELITTVAECLHRPLSEEQHRQAEIARRCLAAWDLRDFEAALAWCSEEIQFYPWVVPPYPAARPVRGRAALRAYCEEVAGYFQDRHATIGPMYPCPHGLAARMHLDWRNGEGTLQQQMIAVCFQVSGEQISQIGVPPGHL